MADTSQLKKKLLDVYSQNPVERVAALANTEGIQDATAPAAINLAMGLTPSTLPINIMRLSAAVRGAGQMQDSFQNTQPGTMARINGMASGLFTGVAPWFPGSSIVNALKKRFPSIGGI